jgi:uncharacterized protein with HEPN domain
MSERDETLYVEDMLSFCKRAMGYAAPLTESTLTADQMRYDAILRNIELLGEASTRLTDDTRALAPEVPWREIVGTRNRLAHGYLGIAAETVWSIINDDLPPLQRKLEALLAKLRQ